MPDPQERIGRASAHVVRIEGDREVVLGQAWLAGPESLVTCGHVVDEYSGSPHLLSVHFPGSGNSYPVTSITLHPDYSRRSDQIVRFDAAVLRVELSPPESSLPPLPFCWGGRLEKNDPLVAARYPVHLGELTDAPEPLAQEGRFLGYLHKQDDYHLLHDLALSPGDSGTAIFDGPTVAAIHCGDTASLPGLNLPTTAIRLALRVDALKALGLRETAGVIHRARTRPLVAAAGVFLAATVLAFLITLMTLAAPLKSRWRVNQPVQLPVDIRFNEPRFAYKLNEHAQIDLAPRNDCNLYLFDVNDSNRVFVLYPLPAFSPLVRSGQVRSVGKFGDNFITVGREQEKLHLVALISSDPLVKETDWAKANPAGSPLMIGGDALMERIHDFERLEPDGVMHVEFDAPRAL